MVDRCCKTNQVCLYFALLILCDCSAQLCYKGRGNSRNIGSSKRRQMYKWYSTKYYDSVMNIKEFLEENLGWQFAGIIADFARKCNKKG